MRARSKQQKDLERKLSYHRVKTLEELAANKYVYTHSLRASSSQELREIVYTGTSEELTGAVLAELQDQRNGEIPRFEQGLVIHDGKGTGALD
ncbi:MAG: hypothetical protein LBH74_08070 [Nitrososphaerota archaeon]|jgi:hypothetical protein|nr:hypothetical protein [Nitrososphaerota archaeon]